VCDVALCDLAGATVHTARVFVQVKDFLVRRMQDAEGAAKAAIAAKDHMEAQVGKEQGSGRDCVSVWGWGEERRAARIVDCLTVPLSRS
jgi:hypothetical protein